MKNIEFKFKKRSSDNINEKHRIYQFFYSDFANLPDWLMNLQVILHCSI